MKSLAIFLFLFTIGAFQCPDGWLQMPGESLCLYPVIAPGFYLDAVRTCQALNANPVKIQNIFENSFVYALIEELNGLTPYIGVEKKADGTWVYSDGSPLIYSNWDKGQPKNSTKLHCVTLNLASGKWIADDCSLARPSACSFIGGNDLVYSNTINQTKAAPIDHGPCWYQYAWIGYSGFGNIGTGGWTDGSPVDYLQGVTSDRIRSYQVTNDTSCDQFGWGADLSSGQTARFVCKKPSRG